MNNIKTFYDNIVFGYHFRRIRRLRSDASHLLEQGAACTDPRLVTISNEVLTHGMKAAQLWRSYRGNAPREQVTV